MIDFSKQIEHWRAGASEDWNVASELVFQGKIRHGLFFAHLALEKTLKAHVCRVKNDIAPPIHNLLRLADRASLSLDIEQRDLLAEVMPFNIEGRYPELNFPAPSLTEAENYLKKIGGLMECLNSLF